MPLDTLWYSRYFVLSYEEQTFAYSSMLLLTVNRKTCEVDFLSYTRLNEALDPTALQLLFYYKSEWFKQVII